MPRPLLPLFLTLALTACDSSSVDTPVSSDAPQPNPVSITETSITDDQATVSWSASGPEPAEHWRLYQNNLLVCSEDLDIDLSSSDASGNYQQSSACTINLEEGDNSVYVQLCNISESGASNCSTSATTQISYEAADPTPGAISWQDLPSSTSNTTINVTWLKADGGNGDYWFVYHNDAQACIGELSYTEDYVAQSADCEVSLTEGVNQLQAELCYDQPTGIQDLCTQSEIASVTLVLDPAKELATPVLDALDASEHYAGIDTNISWYKDTSVGSAGENWSLYQSGGVVCQGQLADDLDSGSCVIQLIEGDNTLHVELCTDIATYSGASCAQSDTLTVNGLDPNPLEPGLMQITNAILGETFDNSLPLNWAMAAGNGVQHWNVYLNGVEYCATSSANEYYEAGSCLLNLVVGINSISVSGCNYGYADSVACTTTDTISTERIALPGTAELTSTLPTTTYDAEHSLSWERNTGASAEYWFASVVSDIDANQCKTELVQQTPQSDSCIVELGSGHNEVYVQTCVYNHNRSSSYCVDSDRLYTELLAPVPTTPEISTESQSIADDNIEIRWSKSSGANGSYWAVINNDAEVAACADQPVITAGDGQSGSCDLPLTVGDNIVSVRLCADNAAGTASCADSATISITRLIASPEFTSAASVTAEENSTAPFYTAVVEDNDSSAEQISFALSGGADVDFFLLDSTSGALAFQSPADYEAPQDSDADNVYQLNITATDELDNSAQLELVVNLSNINDNAPVLTTPPATLTTSENTTAVVYTFTASDLDGDSLSYSLDGADAQHFILDTTSGALQFDHAPDYETPLDANQDNVYELTISVADGDYQSTEQLSISVSDSNDETPQATSASSIALALDSLVVGATIYTVTATDADLDDQITYALGGVDQQHFVLNYSSGALAFSQLPASLDNPQDANGDNIYEVIITLTDLGANSSDLNLSVSVVAVIGNAPEFAQATASVDFDENAIGTVYTASATDADGDALTYSINGDDAEHFAIDAASGVLEFNSAPDHEQPTDSGFDNVYNLIIAAEDPLGNQAQQSLTVSINDLNDNAPQFASSTAALDASENSTAITTITATDADSTADHATLTYSLDGGSDLNLFTIDTASGVLAFNSAPNYESPQDANADNVYELSISVSDSAYTASQDLIITITDVNEAPSFTETSVALATTENNSSFIYTIDAAIDPDQGQTLAYQLSGDDQSAFTLDSTTLTLAFITTPNYENPKDQDTDNTYQITITATDGEYSASQSIVIAVSDYNDEAPQFTSPSSQAVNYSTAQVGDIVYTALATDADADDQIAYALGGADSGYFTFDSSSGALAFYYLPALDDFPEDGSIIYALSITATDLAATSSTLELSVNLLDDTGSPPELAQASVSIAVDENSADTVYTAQASDVDPGDKLSYSISGIDAEHFTINSSSGALAFNSPPDFENPADDNSDNTYELTITVTDSMAKQAQQSLAITVNNINDNSPQFTLSSTTFTIPENTTAITTITATDADANSDTLTYTLDNTSDAAAFTLDPSSGALAFDPAPDYETPLDSDGDNVYQLTLSAFDGANTTSQSITITVADLNDEAPRFTSLGSQVVDYTKVEVGDVIYTASATDADANDQITYALSGADASTFTLDSASGALAFAQLPPLEQFPEDSGITYQLVIAAADLAANSSSLELSVSLLDDTGSAPEFAEASASIAVDENIATSIYTAQATDVDPDDTLSYSLSGIDYQLFSIDASSGALTFNSPPDHEQPLDDGGDNVYDLAIVVTDFPVGNQAQQILTVSVSNLNDNPPQFALISSTFSIPENSTAITTVAASDADGDDLSFSLTNSADSSLFDIDPTSGALAFTSAPDFENPADDNTDNTYELTLSVSDGAHTTTQAITVSVNNIDEAPSFADATQDLPVNENSSGSVYQAQASDPEQATLAYSISGADASRLNLDASSGELAFKNPPNFEAPLDQDANNVYELSITAADGANHASQAVSITVADVNEAPSFTNTSVALDTAENNLSFTHIVDAATDEDSGEQLTYQLSGADQSAFDFDAATRALSFKQSPDYEQPTDQDSNNVYQINIVASDSEYDAAQAITIAVADRNDEAPQFTSASTQSVDYSTAQVGAIAYSAQATDADAGDQITYALGGADAANFDFDSSSGELSFNQLPELEDFPAEGSIDYALTITATDLAANSSELALSISLLDDTGSAPTFAQASASINVDENTASAVYTAQATDVDPGDSLTYSISGTDSSLFTIDPSSGDLSFNTAPDFETPADSGTDNTYDLIITATDSVGKQASQSLAIAVNNLNDNQPQFNLSSSTFSIPENSTAVATIAATDPDGDDLIFALTNTTDANYFTLEPASGVLAFISAPDHENPADNNADNTYELELSVFDGTHTTTQAITVAVADLNDESPLFTSATSLALDFTSVVVGATVYTAQATDADLGDQITYALSGADASHFSFDSSSGALAFSELPSLENPKDDNGDNIYQITITATDLGANSTDLALSVNVVDDTGSAPTFSQASASIAVDENTASAIYTAQASDVDPGDTLTYSISGADHQLFTIDPSSGDLAFNLSPDYENPSDSGADNIYDLTIIATDAIGKQAQQSLTISVNNLNDNQPQFNLSSSAFSTLENSTAVATITASDADGDDLTFSLTNSTDSSFFTLDSSSGVLAFQQAPDFESPQDSNTDNTYELELSVADGANTSSQAITVAVTNVDEAPSFAATTQDLSVSENSSGSFYQAQATDPEQATLTYSASGTDAGLFDLDSASGELTFKQSPHFENPLDSDSNNVYQLDITAADGTNQASQSITVTVADVNEAPAFASASVNLNTDENAASFAHTVDAATDPDQGEQLTYQLGGDDAAAFDFDAATRVLAFKQSPDYESPADQDADNTYQIIITAADSQYSTSQAITIAVADLNDESPLFTSATSLALDFTSVVVGAIVYTAQATDADAGDQVSYALSGADQQHFILDSSSGALAFAQAPSLENPKDADKDNVYQLSIAATDLGANSTDLALSINVVDDTGSAPTFAQASASIAVDENVVGTIYTAQATDVDSGDILTYSISGTDSSLFTIDSSSGELSFNQAPDFENPTDNGADNTYDLAITATDAIGKQASQSLAISVNNLNDNAPQFTLASSAFDVLENTTAVTTIAANDPDGDDLTFALTSTTDSNHFTIDPASGALSFNQAPDFETPQDANADNTYELELSVADGAYTTSATISVSVTNVNDVAPSFAATTDSSSVSENTSGVVYTASATDIEGDSVSYSLAGTDSTHFTIDSSNGELSLANALDFENPQDQNTNNDYELSITASDGTNSAALALTVLVQDLNDNSPAFGSASETIQVPENTSGTIYTASATDLDATDTITYTLSGADSALLQIDPSSGALAFINSPDYENPQDQNINNVYELSIVASDGTNSASLALSIEILDTSERPPEITQLIGGDQAIDFTFDDFGTSEQLSIYRFTDDACSTAELASDHTQCYASDDSSSDTTKIDFSGALSSADYQVSDSGLRAGQRYYYQIWAAESSSASDIGVWSQRYSAMTWPAADVGTTLGYDASETGGTQVVLSFVAPSSGDDDYYHFLRHSDPDCASYGASTALNRADYSDWSALADPVNGGLCSGLTELTLSSTNLHAPSGGASDSHTDSGLAEGTTYYYLLRTVNYSGANGVDFTTRSGASATSNQLHWTTVPPVPAADDLQILSSPPIAADQISIAFASVAGASSYKLVRYIPANCSVADQQISSVESCSGSTGYAEQDFSAAQSSYTDSGLQAGTTYAYQYRALNAAGSSQYSPAVSATTTTLDKPIISLASSVSLADANVISVSWSASSGIDSYSILGSSNESCLISATASADPQASAANCDHSISASAASSATSIDIDQLDDGSALASGSYYYFAAAAVSSSGSSDYSDVASAITAPASPNVISLSPGYQQVEVAWDVPAGSAENVLYRYTESTCSLSSFPSNCGLDTGSYTFTSSIPNDAYIDDNSGNGLLDNQMYYYALQASNAGGARYTESASAPFTLTAPKTPDSLIASGERLAVQLRWGSSPTDADDGVAGYEILRSSSSTCYGSTISAYSDYASCPDAALFLFDYGSGEQQNEYQFSDSELDPSSGSEPLAGGSTYYYWIRSFYGSTNDAVYSASTSAPASATPILPAPTNLAVDAELSASGSSTDISIAWDEVASASGYVLYRTTSADCITITNRNTSDAQNNCADYQREELSGSSTTATTHSSLPSDTIYYYYVAAANSAVEGELSSALSTRSATVAPTITYTETYSNTIVRVEWDASSDYDAKYHLYAYSGDSSCNPFTTECPHESLTTFTADGSSDYYNYAQQLEPGTHYNFKMLAITEYEQEDGTEDFVHGAISSAAATATTAANHPTITGHEDIDYDTTEIFFSIEGGTDSTLFYLLYTFDPSCTANDILGSQCAFGGALGTIAPSSSVILARYDYNIYYYVLSVNADTGTMLGVADDHPYYAVPARPAPVAFGINASKNSSGNGTDIKIEWTQSSGVDGYVLYRTTSANCITDANRNDSSTQSNCGDYQRQEISGSSTTTTTHSNLPNDTIYHYSLATISNGSEGALSDSLSTRTAASAPKITNLETYSRNQIEVTWQPSSSYDAVYYVYAYSGDASCDPHAEVCPGEKLAAMYADGSSQYAGIIGDLTPGTLYNFKSYTATEYTQENGGVDGVIGYISTSAESAYTIANHPTITGYRENDAGDILLEFAIEGGSDDATYYVIRTTNGNCTITEAFNELIYGTESQCTDIGGASVDHDQDLIIYKGDDKDYYYHVYSENPAGGLAFDDSVQPYFIAGSVIVQDIQVVFTYLYDQSTHENIVLYMLAADSIPSNNMWTLRYYPAFINGADVISEQLDDSYLDGDAAYGFFIDPKYYFQPHMFEIVASKLDGSDAFVMASTLVRYVPPPPLYAVEKNSGSNRYTEERDFDVYIGVDDPSIIYGIDTLKADISMIYADADSEHCRAPASSSVGEIQDKCLYVRSIPDWDGHGLLINGVNAGYEGDVYDYAISSNETYQYNQGMFQVYDIDLLGTKPIYDDQDNPWSFYIGPYISKFSMETDGGTLEVDYHSVFSYLAIELGTAAEFEVTNKDLAESLLPTPTLVLSPALLSQGLSAGSAYNSWDLHLLWEAINGINSYAIHEYSDSDCAYLLSAPELCGNYNLHSSLSPDFTHAFAAADMGSYFYYRLQAYDAAGNSSQLGEQIAVHIPQALNDSGVDICVVSDALSGAQDCASGRDASVAASAKVGSGSAGFDFSLLEADANASSDSHCVHDNTTGLSWSSWSVPADDLASAAEPDTDTNATRSSATFAELATISLDACGYSDWSLPSIHELLSIADYNQSEAKIDSSFFTDFNSSQPSYWSASGHILDFSSGDISLEANASAAHSVLLVRGDRRWGHDFGAERFQLVEHIDDGNLSIHLVYDNHSQLHYAPCLAGQSYDPANHSCLGTPTELDYIDSLNAYDSNSTWRQPNIKELIAILDPTNHLLPNPTYFPTYPSGSSIFILTPREQGADYIIGRQLNPSTQSTTPTPLTQPLNSHLIYVKKH